MLSLLAAAMCTYSLIGQHRSLQVAAQFVHGGTDTLVLVRMNYEELG